MARLGSDSIALRPYPRQSQMIQRVAKSTPPGGTQIEYCREPRLLGEVPTRSAVHEYRYSVGSQDTQHVDESVPAAGWLHLPRLVP